MGVWLATQAANLDATNLKYEWAKPLVDAKAARNIGDFLNAAIDLMGADTEQGYLETWLLTTVNPYPNKDGEYDTYADPKTKDGNGGIRDKRNRMDLFLTWVEGAGAESNVEHTPHSDASSGTEDTLSLDKVGGKRARDEGSNDGMYGGVKPDPDLTPEESRKFNASQHKAYTEQTSINGQAIARKKSYDVTRNAIAHMKTQTNVMRKGHEVDISEEKRGTVVGSVEMFFKHVDPKNKLNLRYGATGFKKEQPMYLEGDRAMRLSPDIAGGAVCIEEGKRPLRIIVCEEDKGKWDMSKQQKATGQSCTAKAFISVNTANKRDTDYELREFYFIKYADKPPTAMLGCHNLAAPHALVYWETMSAEDKAKLFRPLTELLAHDSVKPINNHDIFLGAKD